MAEMERDLLVERTQAGLARAKAECKTLGRPANTTDQQRRRIVADYTADVTVSKLARRFAMSRANLLGIVKPAMTVE